MIHAKMFNDNMLNNYPTIRVIFDRRRLASPSKAGYVEVELLFQGKRKWIATGVKVLPDNWHPERRVVGLIEAIDLNLKIESVELPIREFIRKQMVSKQPFTWGELQAFIEISKVNDSFLDFVEKLANERSDIKESTRKNHLKLVRALKEYNTILSFNDLTPTNIKNFEEWLRQRKKDYAQSTIASYHKFLKIYVNEAIRRELIKSNPYAGMKIDRGKQGLRRYLTMDEVSKLEKAELANASLRKVRDLFIFQCYTGLAYADLMAFDFEKVIERNGHFVLNELRTKTSENFYIVLLPPAIEILKRYDNRLPVISNQQYNLRLKVVAVAADIDKPLTTHMARHTYASMCLNAGIKIEVLAKMLGHTDIKTTQIYAKMLNTTVESAFEELEEKINRQKGK